MALEIDHIIPEHFSESPSRLAAALVDLNLPSSFDLNAFSNLLPSHKNCNSKKGGDPFPKSTALFFLAMAEKKAAQAHLLAEAAIRKARTDRVLGSLQIALEAGDLSQSQVLAIMRRVESGEDAFEIFDGVHFTNRFMTGMLKRENTEGLLDEPLLPRQHGLDRMIMVRPQNTFTGYWPVTTCREWAQAISEGYYARSNYDIKEEAFFKRAYSLIQAFSVARVADTSFIGPPKAGINTINMLPVTLLPYLSPDQERELTGLHGRGVNIGDLVTRGQVVVTDQSPHHLAVTYRGMGKAFWDVMHADLNGDGIEDMLVSTYEWSITGTLGYGHLLVLTRKDARAMFEVMSADILLPRQEKISPRPRLPRPLRRVSE